MSRSAPQPLASGVTESFLAAARGGQRTERPPRWVALLEGFYAGLGLCLPAVHPLKGEDMPEPYRQLLVHSKDMTPTLEAFYGQPMRLTVLSRHRENEAYLREVLLRPAAASQPVEYGVIRICLDRFPLPARQAVLAESRPLGNILQAEAIPHLSWPQGFFRIEADYHIGGALGVRPPAILHGRRNVLVDGSRRLLAEVIEVLPPVETTQDLKR
jgi:hypothetical protein